MKRREFVVVAGSALVAAELPAAVSVRFTA